MVFLLDVIDVCSGEEGFLYCNCVFGYNDSV